MLAEYLPLPLPCPYCPGRRLFRAYRDVLNGERVVKVECITHRHPVVDRAYTGTAKSNWGTVGHGPASETEGGEAGVSVAEMEKERAAAERAVRDALSELGGREREETE